MSRKICCLLMMIFLLLCLPLGAQAAEEANILTLSGNVDGLVIDRDTVLDLNGFAVTNATVAQGVTLQLIDSANNDYDADKCGSFAGTVNGTVEQLVQYDAKNYLVIQEEGVYSAHRFYAGITKISLAPNVAGLGYKAYFYADEKINPMVESYGYTMWVNGHQAKTYVKTGTIEKNELTLRVNRILSEDNAELSQLGAEASISGQATITFNIHGQPLTVNGAEHTTTLQQAVELVDAALAADRSRYSDSLVTRVRDLCEKFSAYMPNWQVENIMLKFAPALPEADFLYRVGNKDSVKLEALVKSFTDKALTVSVTSNAGNASVTYNSGSVKFSGTGLVTLTVTEEGDSVPFAMQLEIVDAYNVTTYSQLKNSSCVLLNNITMPSGGSFSLKSGTLFGNGFTVDARNAAHEASANKIAGNYVFELRNAALDNVQIVGAVYPTYGNTAGADYNRALVMINGEARIANCYLSNTAAPVRVYTGSVEVVNTTLKGGSFANLDICAGSVILDGVTTINQENGTDRLDGETVVVGLGIVFNQEVPNTATLEIRNGLTQFNCFSKAQTDSYIQDAQAKNLLKAVFADSTYSMVRYTDAQGDIWANAGIISMSAQVEPTNITVPEKYTCLNASLLGNKGYVWTYKPDDACIVAEPGAYESAGQYIVAPAHQFDYTTKNYVAKTEGSNDFCYYANGVVVISMDEGDSFDWDPSILTVTKYGQNLPYTVTVNGIDYTDTTVSFNKTQDVTAVYTYTDPYNYRIVDGEVTAYSKTYEKTVELSVTAVPATAKDAVFTFYGYSGVTTTPDSTYTETTTVTSSSGKTYIMPATVDNYVATTQIDGVTVNCPVVHVDFKDNSSDFNWLYPLFLGVKIEDYADGGVGNGYVVVDKTSASKPKNLTILTEDKSGWSSESGKTGSEGKLSSGTYKGLYGWTGGALGSDKSASSMIAQFCYKDNKGTEYYYCIQFKRAAHECPSSCVTGDTLVTLADGSQKRIMDVTYSDQLMVWDFYKGEYAVVPAAIIFDHGYDNNTVIKLSFSDGTTVNVINLHQFMDATENRFVTIDAQTVAQYVGHRFAKQDGNGYKTVELVGYEISEQYIEAYGIISAVHYNILVNGMLSTDFKEADYGLFNYFAIGDDMKFDQAAMAEDIANYGLYTYDEFSDYLTYEQFAAFNVPYFKIAVGKGQYTFADILNLIETYLN